MHQHDLLNTASSRQKLLTPCLNGFPIRCIFSIFSPIVELMAVRNLSRDAGTPLRRVTEHRLKEDFAKAVFFSCFITIVSVIRDESRNSSKLNILGTYIPPSSGVGRLIILVCKGNNEDYTLGGNIVLGAMPGILNTSYEYVATVVYRRHETVLDSGTSGLVDRDVGKIGLIRSMCPWLFGHKITAYSHSLTTNEWNDTSKYSKVISPWKLF
ncbi:hypothetical protein C0J52_27493 [Blattella germanica]|nr:hypothetical protein C0J52_27493 [Blattella germanica]